MGGVCGMLGRVGAGRGTELRVAGTTHHRGGRDDGQHAATRVGSLPGD